MLESAAELGKGGWLDAAAALPPLPAANTTTSASGNPTTPATSVLAVLLPIERSRRSIHLSLRRRVQPYAQVARRASLNAVCRTRARRPPLRDRARRRPGRRCGRREPSVTTRQRALRDRTPAATGRTTEPAPPSSRQLPQHGSIPSRRETPRAPTPNRHPSRRPAQAVHVARSMQRARQHRRVTIPTRRPAPLVA